MPPEYVVSPDGTRIAFERAGSGPALLLAHCLRCTRDYWRELGYLDTLGREFTVVAMDTRGFGQSDAPDDPAAYAEERVLDDALAVMDAVGAERFSVWGHSYGATIGRQLAATSDRVARVVMAGTVFGSVSSPEGASQARADLEPIIAAQAASDPAAALDALGVAPEEREKMLALPARSMLFTIESLAHWRPFQPSDLRSPALVVTGTRDSHVLEALEPQRAAIREAGMDVVVLPDLDHAQLVRAPEVALPVVLPFLRG